VRATFDELLARPGERFGTWSQIASPEVIDMLGAAGYDFTIVDCEHGYFGMETAEGLFRACDAAGLAPLVRVPSSDRVWMQKALDAGAAGVVVPGVSSVGEARAVIDATRFAPEGTRGACPCVRAGDHFIRDWPAYVARQAGNGAILLVESRAGLEAIEAICALPGLKCLMIGPFDLSVSLGFRGDYLHPEVQAAIARMVTAANAHRVPIIAPVFSPDLAAARTQVDAWRAQGVRLFVVGTDKILVADQFTRYRAAL
jgi:4-hydroxy-2-oxoheptanedioate aldolase